MGDVTHVDSDPRHLYPPFAALVTAAVAQANHESAGKFAGFAHWALFEGYRSVARQQYCYQIGRTIPPIGKEHVVTNMRTPRFHGVGLAADLVWYGESGQPHWDGDGELWAILGHCARTQGLVWGGGWSSIKDLPHVQPTDYDVKVWTPGARAHLASLGLSVP